MLNTINSFATRLIAGGALLLAATVSTASAETLMMKSDEDLYACHEIPERDRIRLLLAFPPIYPVVKADHGTLSFGVGRDFHLCVTSAPIGQIG